MTHPGDSGGRIQSAGERNADRLTDRRRWKNPAHQNLPLRTSSFFSFCPSLMTVDNQEARLINDEPMLQNDMSLACRAVGLEQQVVNVFARIDHGFRADGTANLGQLLAGAPAIVHVAIQDLKNPGNLSETDIDGAASAQIWNDFAGYYGAVTQFAAHALETIASGESWLKTSYSAKAVAWRHLVCFIMTMCAAGALFLTATIISGDRRIGIFMVAALLSTPVFIGMSVINEKDAPIAAGRCAG